MPSSLSPEIAPLPVRLLSVAKWNDRAAVRAKRKGDHKSVKRHKNNARMCREAARKELQQ